MSADEWVPPGQDIYDLDDEAALEQAQSDDLEAQLRASIAFNKAADRLGVSAGGLEPHGAIMRTPIGVTGRRAQISPSILNSFQDIWNDDAPWMTPEKFKDQLLSNEPMSLPADAGNAVHEAAFDHALDLSQYADDVCLEITNADGNVWWVEVKLLRAIRAQIPEWGEGIPEVPHLITEEELGVPDVQISLRADYLLLGKVYELKTSKRINAEKFLKSAQKMAYLAAFKVPVTFILAQVKITHPRSRPEHVRGMVQFDWVRSIPSQPNSDNLKALQQLVTSCHEFIQKDSQMIAHVRGKKPPVLL